MPKFVAVFQGELWHGHGRPDLELITKCVIEDSSEEAAKKTAAGMIPQVADCYRFPFGSEDDGYSQITPDDIHSFVIPLSVFIKSLEEEADRIRTTTMSHSEEE